MFFLLAQLRFQDKNDRNAEIRKKPGDHVTLNCAIVGIPKPEITWYKNGEKILSNERYSHSVNAEDTRLTLSKLKITDTGMYQCFGSNELENIERSFYLFVQPLNSTYIIYLYMFVLIGHRMKLLDSTVYSIDKIFLVLLFYLKASILRSLSDWPFLMNNTNWTSISTPLPRKLKKIVVVM